LIWTKAAKRFLVTHVNKQHGRVTQSDVARAAGVHRTTVCLALQNHPNIPPETRERVRQCAERLGYAPDPMLSALAAYRTQRRPKAFHGTLAWLANTLPPFNWRKVPIFATNYEGAVACAKSHGYSVEVFDLQGEGMSAARLAGILRSRNISGLLVSPQPRPNMELEFPWEDFSAVTFGYTLTRPELHCVAATQYRATLLTLKRMRELGYRRIGFASTNVQEERVNFNGLAAYLAEMYRHGDEAIVLPLPGGTCRPSDIRRWIRAAKPDAVLVSLDVLDIMKEAGIRIPGEVSVACSMMFDDSGKLAGVRENSFLVGEIAVDFLVAMIQRGERGVPGVPQRVLIEGEWIDGETLPPRGSIPAIRRRNSRL